MAERVLLVIDSFRYGGRLTQARLLADRLAGRGFEPHLCSLSRSGGFGLRGVSAGALHEIGRRHAVDPLTAWRLRQLTRRLRPAIVHAWGDAAAAYAAAACGRKLVVSVDQPPADPVGWRRWLDNRRNKAADLLVAPSEAIAKRVDAGAAVIAPGVDPARAAPDSMCGEVFSELGLPADARVIALAARMLPRKGVKQLLWTADLVRVLRDDMRLLVIGDGPELPVLLRFARMASDLEHLRLLGGRGDVDRLLAAAEVFWHAGDEASAPSAVLEAMAAGLPVVADDTPGCRQAIRSGETGVLVGREARADRARATDRLFTDAAERRRLGDAARQAVRERFSADRMVDAYAEAYRRLLDG